MVGCGSHTFKSHATPCSARTASLRPTPKHTAIQGLTPLDLNFNE